MKLKRTLALGLTLAICASLAIGGTMAYLQDTDSDVNVMTMGSVYIEQHEQQRVDDNENQHELEPFVQGKALLPAVYEGDSIPWADAAEWVVADDPAWKVVEDNANVVDKFITVENTGKSEAYVRTIIAYEGDVYAGKDIHVVHNAADSSAESVSGEFAETEHIGIVNIGGVNYDLFVYTYKNALKPGETTIPSLKQIYMDKTSNNDDVAQFGETYEVLVCSQAVQAAGFADAVTALNAGFGEITVDNNPWKGEHASEKIVRISTSEELAAAKPGDTLMLAPGTYTYPVGLNNVTIIGDGEVEFDTVRGSLTDATIKNVTFSGEHGARWSYPKGKIVFDSCTFTAADAGKYAFHSDVTNADIEFKGCTFNTGVVAFGESQNGNVVEFNNCTFNFNSSNTWGNIRSYTDSSLIGCTFNTPEAKLYVSDDKVVTVIGGNYTDKVVRAGTPYDLGTVIIKDAVTTADELIEALESGEDVVLNNDVKINPAGMSNAYGTTGINVKNGQTIDGAGHTLDIKGAGGTWDSGINTTGGLIKNITVTGSFRGIFINHNSTHSEPVVLENVTIDGTTYTISCDQGMNQTLTATNSTFNGWTSYAGTLGEAEFINCKFGEGNGNAYCRPYAPTSFVNCEFEAGYRLDARAAVTFENCTLGGVALTAENLATLVTNDGANATVK